MATHRQTLQRVHVGFWFFVAATMVILAIVQTAIWALNRQQTELYRAGFVQPQINFDSIETPKPITTARTGALFRDDASIDAYINVVNLNEQWAATDLEYEIFVGGKSTGREHATLAPAQEKYLTKMNIPFTGTSAPGITITIHNTQWEKIINPDETLPHVGWDFQEASIRALNTEDLKTELTFTLRNKSVYGFREPQVVVLLVDDSNAVYAIGSVHVNEIGSLESKPLAFRWPKRFPTSLTPKIIVNVDLLTESRIIRKQ